MQSYAVVQTGGKQYTVKAGDVLKVELIAGKQPGDSVELTTLAAKNGAELMIGSPELAEKVKATILHTERNAKVITFKKRKTKTYRKMQGHRQTVAAIRIDAVPGN